MTHIVGNILLKFKKDTPQVIQLHPGNHLFHTKIKFVFYKNTFLIHDTNEQILQATVILHIRETKTLGLS